MSSAETPVMLRAEVTRDELRELRRLAFEAETSMQEIVGMLIKDYIAKQAAAGQAK